MGVWKKIIELGYSRNSSPGNSKPEIFVSSSATGNSETELLVMVETNEVINKWVPKVRRALRSSARWFSDGKEGFVMRGNRPEKKLAKSIGSYTKKDQGAINLVAFSMERHGVFVHKGVGRGYNAKGNGFVVRTAKGPVTRPRVAVEWFNPILDKNVPALADNIARVNTDAAVNATRMKIN
ncbi:hypothetical protein [Sunxiuqinia sp. sy24]|uniref:hypothetical protein n=1 Tax=Sunxiuqinia sp. sy24 TaxID=3461495 RepID=UPI0040463A44